MTRVHYPWQPMAINSLWQRYLRLQQCSACGWGSACWNVKAQWGTNTCLIDVKEVEEDKNNVMGKGAVK